MNGTEPRPRANDPYAPVPAWRVDEIERRIDRAERRTEHVESRINQSQGLGDNRRYQGLGEGALIGLSTLVAILAIIVAVASHH